MKEGDVEAAEAPLLYPGMMENPQLRWAFIRKIYSIITLQLLLTIAVCAVIVAVHPIADFLVTTRWAFQIVCILPFIILIPMYICRQWHPINFLLLALYTVSISLLVGLICAFTSGRVVLEAAGVTLTLVVSLTLYTFWAESRGHDFQFLWPFLSCSLFALTCFTFIEIFFPFDKITNMIMGILGTILFSGYIIYNTGKLIKRYSYDEYIWASVSLYLDILNLFVSLVRLFGGGE